MPARFIAATGPAETLDRLADRLAGRRDIPLEPALRTPRLAVWAEPGALRTSASDGSALAVGPLFDRTSSERVDLIGAPVPAAADFVKRYWGAYVLFADRGGYRHPVMRDPSGAVPTYHRCAGDLDVYASDTGLLFEAFAGRAQPDLAYLREWLTFPYLRTSRTGIVGVSEILPGTVHHSIGQEARRIPVWDPIEFAQRQDTVADAAGAEMLLRDAILTCVAALADRAGDIVLELSGGLDSSIVAAALAAAGAPFRAVTFVTRAPDGDERVYARAVADRCGVELAELHEATVAADFEGIAALAPRPPPNPLLQPLHRALDEHLASTGAQAVFDGAGGDNVFCNLNSAAPVLDVFPWRGLHETLATLQDVARIHDATLTAVARSAIRGAMKSRVAWPSDRRFLAPEAVAPAAGHPWLDPAARIPLGTFEQLQSIVGIRHFLPDPQPDTVPSCHPLLAQPVMEACLRIRPSLWVRDGRDRAVARGAFRELLPERIVHRRSKGRLESMFMTGYMRSRREIETILAEGRLASAGLLDREAIVGYLRREGEPKDPGYIRLLDLCSAESWLRAFDP